MPSLLTLQTLLQLLFDLNYSEWGKTLSQGGGIQREQILRGWKECSESVWSLCISSMEVHQQLVKHKRQVERELNQEAQKRFKLENDLATLKGEMSTLQKAHKNDKQI